MPDRELEEKIRRLTPGALASYKRQLAALPEVEKQRIFSRLSGIPELADIVGTPITAITETEPQQRRTLTKAEEIPLWQKGLQTATAPFRWFEEHVTQPFGAVATAPFTPGLPGGRRVGESHLAYARRQYEQWKEPTITMPWGGKFRPVKGLVETIPWFFIPPIGAVGGRGIAGAMGRLGKAGQVAGKALEYSPLGLAEKGTGKAIGFVGRKIAKKTGIEAARLIPSESRLIRPFTEEEISEITRLASSVPRWAAPKEGMVGSATGLRRLPTELRGEVRRKIVANVQPGYKKHIGDRLRDFSPAQIGYHLREMSGLPSGRAPLTPEGIAQQALKAQATARAIAGAPLRAQMKAALQKEVTSVPPRPAWEARIIDRESFAKQLAPLADADVHFFDTMDWKRSGFHSEKGFRSVEVGTQGATTNEAYLVALHETAHGKMKHLGMISTIDQQAEAWLWAERAAPNYGLDISDINGLVLRTQNGEKILAALNQLREKGVVEVLGEKGAARVALQYVSSPRVSTPDDPIIQKLLALVKAGKPLRKETRQLYKAEHARRAERALGIRDAELASGKTEFDAWRDAMAAMSKEYPRADLSETFIQVRNAITPDELNTMGKMIRETVGGEWFDYLNTMTAFQNLMLEKIPTRSEMALLEKVFGSELIVELLKKRPLTEKIGDFIIELANIPRAWLASGDLSYILRQGAMGLTGYPKAALKTLEPSIRALYSDEWATTVDALIRSRPYTAEALARKAGGASQGELLAITPLPIGNVSARFIEREEPFMSQFFSRLGENIPWFKSINFVRMSNKAYVTGLNDLRSRIMEQVMGTAAEAKWYEGMLGRFIEEGVPRNLATARVAAARNLDIDEMALLINAATGRGKIPTEALQRAGGLLNAIFFAPKLIISRFEVFRYLWSPSPIARRESAKILSRFFGTGAGILTAAKMSGAADVELDPRSADFGKMKVGETRLDISTGYAQYSRFIAQIATAQRKTAGGRIASANRLDVALRLAQTKLSPAAGFVNDLMRGETFLGEDLPPKSASGIANQAYQRMMPLAIQGMVDGIQQDGIWGGVLASSEFFGVTTTTYTDEVKRARDKASQQEYGMSWQEVGQRLGRAAQIRLDQTSDLIKEAQQDYEERFYGGTRTNMDYFRREGQMVEETYREAVDLAAKEFRVTENGSLFRDKVGAAEDFRRQAYGARAKRTEFQDIIAFYNQPIPSDRFALTNPGDIARKAYYQAMFSVDMYDEFKNYRFEEARKREQEFIAKYGQDALNYVEEYRASRWLDKPSEMMALEAAREVLRPYWQIEEQVWAMYPPELRIISDRIKVLERNNPDRAKQELWKYPQILRARESIARYKKDLRLRNPEVDQAYQVFYR